MPVLIDHLERRFGRIEGGRSITDVPAGAPISVVRFIGGEIAGSVTYATVGLSNRPLRCRVSDRDLYIEIFACEYNGPESDDSLPGWLEIIAGNLVGRKSALLRGDVVRLDGPLRPSSSMVAFYVTLPVYFDDAFKSVQVEDGRRVAIAWLLPIGPTEIDFIERFGYGKFEEELGKVNPDLYDLNRPEIAFRDWS